jgi:hypothetical protein
MQFLENVLKALEKVSSKIGKTKKKYVQKWIQIPRRFVYDLLMEIYYWTHRQQYTSIYYTNTGT